ncbi:hypothetical protein [Haloterrigena alkaliphila]|nr:hypothetical protein [Haloterrigena alkaliphila]
MTAESGYESRSRNGQAERAVTYWPPSRASADAVAGYGPSSH